MNTATLVAAIFLATFTIQSKYGEKNWYFDFTLTPKTETYTFYDPSGEVIGGAKMTHQGVYQEDGTYLTTSFFELPDQPGVTQTQSILYVLEDDHFVGKSIDPPEGMEDCKVVFKIHSDSKITVTGYNKGIVVSEGVSLMKDGVLESNETYYDDSGNIAMTTKSIMK